MSCSLANFVVKIKWAILRNRQIVYVDYNKKNLFILELFLKEGCIRSFCMKENIYKYKRKICIKVILSYIDNISLIKDIELISKPSNKLYKSNSALWSIMYKNIFQGFYVISTNNGLCVSNKLLLNSISNRGSYCIAGEILIKVLF